MHAPEHYDVAVLGTGLGGTMLAAVLARQGHRVVMIEKEGHPRFALGESMILEASQLMRLLADRYDVPEIGHLSTIQTAERFISTTSGVKRNFSFVYHRAGQPQQARESTMTPIPAFPYGHELHMHRQDVDAYMFAVATKYGAVPLQRTEVVSVVPDDAGVALTTHDKRTLRVRFVADATGQRSVLANAFGLRPTENPHRAHSRALFTHMVGVRPYHAFGHRLEDQGLPSPLFEGTCHHIFEGGWMWIIPFNNHPGATNPLCSVGLNLDPRVWPKPAGPPEQEWEAFLARFPTLRPQFEGASTVRRWISTDRLQYTTTRCVGPRWALLAHASGAVDALFSRGMCNTTASIHALAGALLDALKHDRFTVEQFQPVQDMIHRIHDLNDKLVASSYTAFTDFRLWNAWQRVWVIGAFIDSARLIRQHLRYRETGDTAFLDVTNQWTFRSLGGGSTEYHAFFEQAVAVVAEVQEKRLAPGDAADQLFALIRKQPYLPPMARFNDPEAHYPSRFDVAALVQIVTWGKLAAPRWMRDNLYDYSLLTMARERARWQPISLDLQKRRNWQQMETMPAVP